MTGYGWSWRLCRVAYSGCSALARKPDRCCSPSIRQTLARQRSTMGLSGFFPEYGFSKKCHCGLVSGVDFTEPVGAVSCGVGSMLLLAITTRRVHA